MKTKNEFSFEPTSPEDEFAALDFAADYALDERAERLFEILQEMENFADGIPDEQFCELVHQAVRACGFADAMDAWVSLVVVTQDRIGLIDLRDVMPQPPDIRN